MSSSPKRGNWRIGPLAWSMMAVVGSIAALAYLDAQRESELALADFAEEQATLAGALAAAADPERGLSEGAKRVERPGASVVLVLPPGARDFRSGDGRTVSLEPARAALLRGERSVQLSRPDAAALGLPPRIAMAGVAFAPRRGPDPPWGVAIIASAGRERDREIWARRRLILSVLTAAGLVFVFGGVALRKQRSALSLQHDLALAQMRQQADERLLTASRATTLGTLAMGVAHEIATPLGVITVRAEQLVSKLSADERGAAAVRAIVEQCERINQIIRGLLGLARGDTPAATRLDPRSVVDGAIGMVAHRFSRAGVGIHTSDPGTVPAITGDERLLEQALVNLLLNACDASSPGSSVEVTLEREHDHVVMSVIDHGIGISSADAERALQPFFTTKPEGQGSGLGLAVAQEIVNSHRGALSIGPVESGGTRAVIRLPVREDSHA